MLPLRNLERYQAVFKHLLLLKCIERDVGATWRLLQPSRALPAAAQPALKRCCALCHALLAFFQEYLRYVTFDVLEPLWRCLEARARPRRAAARTARTPHAAAPLRPRRRSLSHPLALLPPPSPPRAYLCCPPNPLFHPPHD